MNKLCRQVSIESPGPALKDCVFSLVVPVPETPRNGARVKVVCAGACYRRHRSPSISSISSVSSDLNELIAVAGSSPPAPQIASPAHHGLRDGALFPGFEVAGIIDELGEDVEDVKNDEQLYIGQRVVIYPFEGVPNGYAEYIVVPHLKYLIPIPDKLPLAVSAMLPSGALLAMNAILIAQSIITELINNPADDGTDKCILIVGTGGLALWAVRIAEYYFNQVNHRNRVLITVASLRDEGLLLAKEMENVNVVQWNEDLYEKQLIERTIDACNGTVNIVLDFGTTSRSLHRSLQCLAKGGIVLISEEVGEKLLPKFSRRAEERQQKIQTVATGTIEQLKELVELVASKKVDPPPYSVFPFEEAMEVVRKLCHSEIVGRAILKFHDIE